MKKIKSKKIKLLLIIFAPIILIIYFSNVDTTLTEDDIGVISQLGLDDKCKNVDDLLSQVACVSEIQQKVFSIVDVIHPGIRHNLTREPKDLIKEQKGLCFDRSRFIEKILSYYDIKYRHVAIHYTQDNSSFPFLKKRANSHAFTEISTEKGWMVVDSVDTIIGFDSSHKVYSAKDLRENLSFIDVNNNSLSESFTTGKYSVIYGLYSRHGRFFPPFNGLPDINWVQLITYNIPFM